MFSSFLKGGVHLTMELPGKVWLATWSAWVDTLLRTCTDEASMSILRTSPSTARKVIEILQNYNLATELMISMEETYAVTLIKASEARCVAPKYRIGPYTTSRLLESTELSIMSALESLSREEQYWWKVDLSRGTRYACTIGSIVGRVAETLNVECYPIARLRKVANLRGDLSDYKMIACPRESPGTEAMAAAKGPDARLWVVIGGSAMVVEGLGDVCALVRDRNHNIWVASPSRWLLLY